MIPDSGLLFWATLYNKTAPDTVPRLQDKKRSCRHSCSLVDSLERGFDGGEVRSVDGVFSPTASNQTRQLFTASVNVLL